MEKPEPPEGLWEQMQAIRPPERKPNPTVTRQPKVKREAYKAGMVHGDQRCEFLSRSGHRCTSFKKSGRRMCPDHDKRYY